MSPERSQNFCFSRAISSNSCGWVDRPTATHGCGWPLDAADVKLCRPFGDALPVTDGVPTARPAAAAPPGRRRGALAATRHGAVLDGKWVNRKKEQAPESSSLQSAEARLRKDSCTQVLCQTKTKQRAFSHRGVPDPQDSTGPETAPWSEGEGKTHSPHSSPYSVSRVISRSAAHTRQSRAPRCRSCFLPESRWCRSWIS